MKTMKTADHIELAEEPLGTILPIDADAEMMEHFGIFTHAVDEHN